MHDCAALFRGVNLSIINHVQTNSNAGNKRKLSKLNPVRLYRADAITGPEKTHSMADLVATMPNN